MAEATPICDFGWKAPSFTLRGVDGKTYSLEGLRGRNGTLVMFICNHCPYVKAVIDRIVRDANELNGAGRERGRHFLERRGSLSGRLLRQHEALCRSSIALAFPISMTRAKRLRAPMTQPARPTFSASTPTSSCNIAGVSMPAEREPAGAGVRRELFQAMKEIAATGAGPRQQTPSIGCSIKWKAS